MNLIQGQVKDGVFSSENITIKGLKVADGDVTLGFRAEDAAIIDTADQAQISAPTYAMELLGDATMVTVVSGQSLVAVKAHKEFRTEIGNQVSISVPEASCHLFDSKTGERVGD